MDCNSIRDLFLNKQSPTSPEAEAHIQTCAQCQELLQHEGLLGKSLASIPSLADPTDDLFQLLAKNLGRERGIRAYLRSRPTPLRVGLVLLVASLTAAPAFAHRPHVLTELRSWAIALVFLLGLVLGCRGALPKLSPTRFPLVGLGAALGILALPLFLAWFPFTATWPLTPPIAESGAFVSAALKCFFYGLFISVPLAVSLWLTSREDTWALRSLLFAAGATGIAANLALHAHCTLTHPLHFLLGHATLPGIWLLTLWGLHRRRKTVA